MAMYNNIILFNVKTERILCILLNLNAFIYYYRLEDAWNFELDIKTFLVWPSAVSILVSIAYSINWV